MRAMSILEDRGSFEEKGERTRIPGGGGVWKERPVLEASVEESGSDRCFYERASGTVHVLAFHSHF